MSRRVFGLATMAIAALSLSSCSLGSFFQEPLPFVSNSGNSTNEESLPTETEEEGSSESGTDTSTENENKYSNFSIHVLELGSSYTGNCVYVKAGDLDILLDAGSTTSSIPTIEKYIDTYCTDGIIEYAIATNNNSEHISGFTDTNSYKGIFTKYDVRNIIDVEGGKSTIYSSYKELRDKEISLGATHYYYRDLFKENKPHDSVFELTNNVKMTILDNPYYNASISVLFTVDNNKSFLFTSDLDSLGEESLLDANPSLGEVDFYLAGNHGLDSSSSEKLLERIKPKTVAVSACAGSSELTGAIDSQFVSQSFINRIARYTQNVYVTSLARYEVSKAQANNSGESKVLGVEVGKEYLKQTGYTSFNGNIIVSAYYDRIDVKGTNNNTVLKDSSWLNTVITIDGVERQMRIWPSI